MWVKLTRVALLLPCGSERARSPLSMSDTSLFSVAVNARIVEACISTIAPGSRPMRMHNSYDCIRKLALMRLISLAPLPSCDGRACICNSSAKIIQPLPGVDCPCCSSAALRAFRIDERRPEDAGDEIEEGTHWSPP